MIEIPKHILAIDPGKMMGVCRFVTFRDTPTLINASMELPGTMTNCVSVFEEWKNGHTVHRNSDRLIIVEDWDYRDNQFAVDARLAVEPMAWFKMLGAQWGIRVITQRPQTRLQITDEVLHDSGYWLKGGKGHARSASQHGLSYIVRNLHRPSMTKLYGENC